MNLRIWWIPQIPGKPFRVEVDSLEKAKLLLNVLSVYDRFQFANRIKTDYSNAGGLEIFWDGEWVEWYDDEGNDIWGTSI